MRQVGISTISQRFTTPAGTLAAYPTIQTQLSPTGAKNIREAPLIEHVHLFHDKQKIKRKIEAYFAERKKRKKRVSVNSLALWLGCDRGTIYYHHKRGGEIADLLEQAFQK